MTDNFKFLNTTIDLGIIDINSSHEVKWKHNGTPKDIYQILAGCSSCTKDLIAINNEVKGVFTEKNAKELAIEQAEKLEYYELRKEVDVYLNDGIPIIINTSRGREYNPEKEKITLSFTAKIKGSDIVKYLKNV
jgi:hypothetical protein